MIENDVWIGHGATIMGGVIIHNGAVVGANAVVTYEEVKSYWEYVSDIPLSILKKIAYDEYHL